MVPLKSLTDHNAESVLCTPGTVDKLMSNKTMLDCIVQQSKVRTNTSTIRLQTQNTEPMSCKETNQNLLTAATRWD